MGPAQFQRILAATINLLWSRSDRMTVGGPFMARTGQGEQASRSDGRTGGPWAFTAWLRDAGMFRLSIPALKRRAIIIKPLRGHACPPVLRGVCRGSDHHAQTRASLIICLILFSAVSCRRAADEVKIKGGGPGNPDEIGALVVPPKAPPTEAELDREQRRRSWKRLPRKMTRPSIKVTIQSWQGNDGTVVRALARFSSGETG